MVDSLCKIMAALNLLVVAALATVSIFSRFPLPYVLVTIWCAINAAGWFRLQQALSREQEEIEEVTPQGLYYPAQHDALLRLERFDAAGQDAAIAEALPSLHQQIQEMEQTGGQLEDDIAMAETIEARQMLHQMTRENALLLARARRLLRRHDTE